MSSNHKTGYINSSNYQNRCKQCFGEELVLRLAATAAAPYRRPHRRSAQGEEKGLGRERDKGERGREQEEGKEREDDMWVPQYFICVNDIWVPHFFIFYSNAI
jgi:hypothetical protein